MTVENLFYDALRTKSTISSFSTNILLSPKKSFDNFWAIFGISGHCAVESYSLVLFSFGMEASPGLAGHGLPYCMLLYTA